MQSQIMYRLCPTPTLTLNNRWHYPVRPKRHVFFIPWDGGLNPSLPATHNKHIVAWISFLKRTKRRRKLFLFTVRVEYSKREDRILQVYNDQSLQETLIPVDYLGARTIIKVQSV